MSTTDRILADILTELDWLNENTTPKGDTAEERRMSAKLGHVALSNIRQGLRVLGTMANGAERSAELGVPCAKPEPRMCTCLGSCKGAEGLAPGWVCAVGRVGVSDPPGGGS